MTDNNVSVLNPTIVTTMAVIAALTIPSPFIRSHLKESYGHKALQVESCAAYLISFSIGAVYGFNLGSIAPQVPQAGWAIISGVTLIVAVFAIRRRLLD